MLEENKMNLPFTTCKHNSWVDPHTIRQLKKISPKNILDIGCGDGFYGKLAKYLFPNVYIVGIDANPKWVNECNSLFCYNEVIQGDIVTTIDSLNGEAVIAGDVLEHLKEKDMQYVLDKLVKNFKWIIINSPLGFQPQTHQDTWEIHRCGLIRETFNLYEVIEFNYNENMFNVLLKGKVECLDG